MSAMFRSLRVRNFTIWFVGSTISSVGAWMQATTQSWVVLTELTANDAAAVGVTMALQFGPPLALVSVAGWISDRFDRRYVIFITQSLLALISLGLGLLLLGGHATLWQFYVFAALIGVVNAVDAPTRQAFVSDLVSQEHMSNAVSLNAASFNAARLVGPAVAGLLIATIGSGWVFLVNAATYLTVLVAVVMLRSQDLYRVNRSHRRVAMSEGFRYIRGRGDLAVLFVVVFLIGAFGMNFPIFSSTMTVEFGRDASDFGLLSSILAVGSLAGALMAARRERARLTVTFLAAGLYGLSATASALSPTFWTYAALGMVSGFAIITLLTTANGYTQSTSDPAVRGRVVAIYMAIMMGSTVVGAPLVGWVADVFGPRWALGVGAAAGFLALVIGVIWLVIARGLRLEKAERGFWRVSIDQTGAIPMSDVTDTRIPVPATTSPVAIVKDALDETR